MYCCIVSQIQLKIQQLINLSMQLKDLWDILVGILIFDNA